MGLQLYFQMQNREGEYIWEWIQYIVSLLY